MGFLLGLLGGTANVILTTILSLAQSIGGGIMSIAKQGMDAMMQYHDKSIQFARSVGMTYKESQAYANVLIDRASELGIKYGIAADKVMELQENKAVNLSLAAPKVTNVLIKPGQTFSFWRLVGSTHKKYGYKEGLQISNGKVSAGVGGGMCQFTNLIHWIVCHTPLKIIEHHHHDRFDLFPDFNRQVPFGMGTSIFNNYLDYRFFNPTDTTFQLITYVKDEYLCAQMRSDKPTKYSYHIKAENERFEKKGEQFYRLGEVYRTVVDKRSGNIIKKELLRKNNALVMYKLENND